MLTLIAAGTCLLAASLAVILNCTVFNSGFHKYLYQSTDLYNNAYSLAVNELNTYIENSSANTDEFLIRYKPIITSVSSLITDDFIKRNIDSVTGELMEYLSGKRQTLPDLSLTSISESLLSEANLTFASDIAGITSIAGFTTDSLAKIDKVNLSAFLMYADKDISSYLQYLRLVYYISYKLPVIALTAYVILMLLGSCIYHSVYSLKIWINLSFFSFCVLSLILAFTAAACYISAFVWLKSYIMSVPTLGSTILAYINKLVFLVLLLIALLGIIPVLYRAFLHKPVNMLIKPVCEFVFSPVTYICKFTLSQTKSGFPTRFLSRFFSSRFSKQLGVSRLEDYIIVVNSLILYLAVFFSSYFLVYQLKDIKSDMKTRGLSRAAFSTLKAYQSKEVISAENDGIYSFSLKLIDNEGNPVSGANIKIKPKDNEHADNHANSEDIINYASKKLTGNFVNGNQTDNFSVDKLIGNYENNNQTGNFEDYMQIDNYINNEQTDDFVDNNACYLITDKNGIAKLTLYKGSFELEFVSSNLMVLYNMPSGFSFDLTQPGTSVYTVILDNKVLLKHNIFES